MRAVVRIFGQGGARQRISLGERHENAAPEHRYLDTTDIPQDGEQNCCSFCGTCDVRTENVSVIPSDPGGRVTVAKK
jgi:hypothetical protein